jgi:hypothetical protein
MFTNWRNVLYLTAGICGLGALLVLWGAAMLLIHGMDGSNVELVVFGLVLVLPNLLVVRRVMAFDRDGAAPPDGLMDANRRLKQRQND